MHISNIIQIIYKYTFMRLTIIDIPFIAISLINALYVAFVFIFILISFATG